MNRKHQASVLLAVLAFIFGSLSLSQGSTVFSQTPQVAPDDPVAVAREYLRRNAATMGVRPDLPDLQVEGVRHSLTADHVTFQQTYHGIPVHRAQITVHVDKQQRASSTSLAAYRPNVAVPSVTAALGASAAIVAATDKVAPNSPLRQPGRSEPVIYTGNAGTVLAWKVQLATAGPPADWEVLVDATTGAVLESTNLIRGSSGFVPKPR